MIKTLGRTLFAGLWLVAFTGCKTEGIFTAPKCDRCLNGTCDRHNKKADDGLTSPSPTPFAPFDASGTQSPPAQ